jgi:hypothetical protein
MRKFNVFFLVLVLFIVVSGCQTDHDDLSNVVPVSNAGVSQTVTLPVNGVTLSGNGTDADGRVVAYLWSQVSGPEATIIVNPGSPSTLVKGFIAGNYLFQLMVTDDAGATGVDTVSIKVNGSTTEQTLTLQPANNPNERTLANTGGTDISFTGGSEWVLDAWTVGGAPFIGRKAVKFDLSGIPATATILSANLFLYSNTPPENGNLVDANFGADNSLVLQRITSSWTPATATWANQPATTTTNQVIIPSTTQSSLDINVDVKNLVTTMVSGTNNGFFIKLQNEVIYTSRMFVGSYHTTKTQKHPKLVIIYRP